MSKTLFEKIISREIPAAIVYEDDLVVAFRDIRPQAPTHVLIVPRKPIPRMAEATPEDHQVLGHLLPLPTSSSVGTRTCSAISASRTLTRSGRTGRKSSAPKTTGPATRGPRHWTESRNG